MIKNLLIKQLNQELLAAAQMAYVAGIVKNSNLREHLLKFAKDELEHFSTVANIVSEMGYEKNIEPFHVNLEKDELKALIILEAAEDTMIHFYEEMLFELKEPFKSRIREQVNEELDHKKKMKHLLKEAKKNMNVHSG